MLPQQQAGEHWRAAAAAASIVLAADAALLFATFRPGRRQPAAPSGPSGTSGGFRLPDPLTLEVVPASAVWASAIAACLLALAALTQGLATWSVVLFALVPWLPVLVIEGMWKYRRYGVYVFFVMVALLQTGHLGEHTAQVSQLLMTGGDLDRSHGVFGRLDFETVHFFWDTAIWLTACAVVFKFPRNGWLWTSFAFASLHETEHLYLYWLYLTHGEFYMQGGLAGIMGHGGVIGSPLPRPYLHFMYNFLITVPLLIGLRQQAGVVSTAARKKEARDA